MKRQRIGRNMRRACAFIDRHPGCKIIDVALHLLPPGERSCPSTLSAGYATVHRCIDARLVDGNWNALFGSRYRLTTTEAGRALAREEKNR